MDHPVRVQSPALFLCWRELAGSEKEKKGQQVIRPWMIQALCSFESLNSYHSPAGEAMTTVENESVTAPDGTL